MVRALENNPRPLTGEGHLAPRRAILRFIDLLDAGVAGTVRPACPRCHRVVRIDKPLDGQRVCRNCIAKSRFEECVRRGARREPATRDAEGRPLCPSCLVRDPANLETRIVCGESRMVNSRTTDGPICPNCRPLPILLCSICGRTAPCMLSKLTGLPRCGGCDRRRAHCTVCGRMRGIHSGTADAPVCGPCTTPDAELALQHVAVRRSHAVLAQADSPWLFPGGRPGRPISAWVMGERLRKLGIRLAEARSTALFQLATELPAAVLARTLGIDITVAVTWQRAAVGDWAAYAAEVGRRTPPQPPIHAPGAPT
ncbi:hypothetical protein ACF1FX_27765 [Streptomyces sp. NPDC014646]|uniref:hypothetical protein n=1 Tax=unclassified Streptomyces TaxID=2593676 RepID=UPI0036FCEA32